MQQFGLIDINKKEETSPISFDDSYRYVNMEQRISDEDDVLIPNIPEIFEETIHKLDTVQRLKLLFTFMNYFTKIWAIYLMLLNKDEVFTKNSLLLFSYILYTFLDVVAFIAAMLIVVMAKIINIIFGIQTYYLDNSGCLPILLTIFRFSFIVTFLVQSITLLIFSSFDHYQYPLLLVYNQIKFYYQCSSLLCILTLQLLRIILLVSNNFQRLHSWMDLECCIQSIAPDKYNKAYKFIKLLMAELFSFYQEMDPHLKRRMNQIKNIRDKANEFEKEVNWVKNFIRKSLSKPGSVKVLSTELPEIKEARPEIEQSGVLIH